MNEPVVQYGPFVMNTEQEIKYGFVKYQKIQFDCYPLPNHEQAYARESGRFTMHVDATEENEMVFKFEVGINFGFFCMENMF